jgi:hypothetical protein
MLGDHKLKQSRSLADIYLVENAAKGQRLNLYVNSVIFAGIVLLGIGMFSFEWKHADSLYVYLFIFLLNIVLFNIGYEIEKFFITLFNVAVLFAAIVLNPLETFVITSLSSGIGDFINVRYINRKKYGIHVNAFNGFQIGISGLAASYVFHSLSKEINFQSISFFLSAIIASFVIELLSAFFVSIAVALQEGFNPLDIMFSVSSIRYFGPTFSNVVISSAMLWAFINNMSYLIVASVFGLILVIALYSKEERFIKLQKETVLALLETVGARDQYTKHHSLRVSELSTLVAKEMKLPYRAVRNIEIAALLHDLGKINFPDKAFTQKHIDYETWKIIKKHPEVSESIMNHLSDFRDITQYVSLHHERYDGSGYPNKLSLDDIPVAARILAVVDSFDAMTSNRAYRRAFPIEFALKEINDYKGKSYDPEVVDAFMSVISRVIADIEERLRKEDLTQKFAVRRYQ